MSDTHGRKPVADTTEPENDKDKRRRLASVLAKHPGREVEIELGGLALSARTFDVNVYELLRAVEWYENTIPNPFQRPGRRRELWEFLYEVARLFQNAIASGESFLAHCDAMVTRRYRKHPSSRARRVP
jgi:hypothetical protein